MWPIVYFSNIITLVLLWRVKLLLHHPFDPIINVTAHTRNTSCIGRKAKPPYPGSTFQRYDVGSPKEASSLKKPVITASWLREADDLGTAQHLLPTISRQIKDIILKTAPPPSLTITIFEHFAMMSIVWKSSTSNAPLFCEDLLCFKAMRWRPVLVLNFHRLCSRNNRSWKAFSSPLSCRKIGLQLSLSPPPKMGKRHLVFSGRHASLTTWRFSNGPLDF